MNIYAKEGTKVVFLGKNGTDYDLEKANEVLEVGKTYTVAYTDVGSWRTEVYFEEISGGFNSVMFIELDEYNLNNEENQ